MSDQNTDTPRYSNKIYEQKIRRILNPKLSFRSRQKNIQALSNGKFVIPIAIIKCILEEIKLSPGTNRYSDEVHESDKVEELSQKEIFQTPVRYNSFVSLVSKISKISDLISEVDNDPYYEYFVLDVCCRINKDDYQGVNNLSQKEFNTALNCARAFVSQELTSENKQIIVKALEFLEWDEPQDHEKFLLPLLSDDDYMVRAEAAINYGRINAIEAPKVLVNLLDDSSSYVRLCAVLALGKFCDGELFDKYVEIIQNQEEWIKVRIEALRSLELSKDTRTINFLKKIVTNGGIDYSLREAGINTINKQYFNQLLDTFSELLSSENVEITQLVAKELGHTHTRKNTDILLNIFYKHHDSQAGKQALYSLLTIGKALPDNEKRMLVTNLLRLRRREEIFDYLIIEISNLVSPKVLANIMSGLDN